MSKLIKRHKEEESEEIEVRVAKIGGEVKNVVLDNGDISVQDALVAAQIDYSGKVRIRVNGEMAELDDELEDGDRVTVTGKITGGK